MIEIRKTAEQDIPWIRALFISEWSSDSIVTRGYRHRPEDLQGFIAEIESVRIGLLTYKVGHNEYEIVSLNSLEQNKGIGTTLLNAIMEEASDKQIRRIWVTTTNDNTEALSFYQKRGFRICAIYQDAIDEHRKIKPEIPLTGFHGMPIRDELELEILL